MIFFCKINYILFLCTYFSHVLIKTYHFAKGSQSIRKLHEIIQIFKKVGTIFVWTAAEIVNPLKPLKNRVWIVGNKAFIELKKKSALKAIDFFKNHFQYALVLR